MYLCDEALIRDDDDVEHEEVDGRCPHSQYIEQVEWVAGGEEINYV